MHPTFQRVQIYNHPEQPFMLKSIRWRDPKSQLLNREFPLQLNQGYFNIIIPPVMFCFHFTQNYIPGRCSFWEQRPSNLGEKKERERGTEESAAIVPIVEWIQTFDIFPDGPLLFFSTGHKKLCCYLCHCVAETGGLCGPSTPPFGHFQNKWRIILASHSLTLGLSPTDSITFPSQKKKMAPKN